ncbi:NAD(P)-dependent oxidoreductase [Exiguobacterium acetylicum]|uniref:NAD(P)-dependent oxidoreductase n=1 Tax=Exiguobacterium acetylicum TaxID=41170 RepID=UPI001EE36BE6|nr:NAD(P)-dependent oxidoreductase [Exiguobacterium acetylicum]UKS57178.1 NAD(P)-dependent oxidoreductase [Exiguobacterium acetylicum]
MKTVGFIGLGVMGQGMVRNLRKAGFAVKGYNRTKEKGLVLEADGVEIVDTIQDVVTDVDVVISIVGYPQDVEQIYLENGILDHAAPGTILIDMTTSSPALAERIAKEATTRGLQALDAPVTGGDLGAKNGTLAILVGGEDDAFTKAKPLFEAMGKSISLFGGPGKGQSAKLANQIAIAGSMIGTAEMLLFVTRSGIDPTQFIETIKSGSAGSWSLENLIPRVIAENYSPGFFVKHFIKDMRLALERGAEMGIATPGLALVKDLYEELAEMGHADSGTQALYLLLAERSRASVE